MTTHLTQDVAPVPFLGFCRSVRIWQASSYASTATTGIAAGLPLAGAAVACGNGAARRHRALGAGSEAGDSCVRERLVLLLRVLPRRAGAVEAARPAPHILLPDDCARRRAGQPVCRRCGPAHLPRLLQAPGQHGRLRTADHLQASRRCVARGPCSVVGHALGDCRLQGDDSQAGAGGNCCSWRAISTARCASTRWPAHPGLCERCKTGEWFTARSSWRRTWAGTQRRITARIPASAACLAARRVRRAAWGIIGLGCGTLACYARPDDRFRYYEINPLVVSLARSKFRYLADCAGTVEVVLGDARLSLERETPQDFDVLVVDAFSGDSIPMHLLTREAFDCIFAICGRGECWRCTSRTLF